MDEGAVTKNPFIWLFDRRSLGLFTILLGIFTLAEYSYNPNLPFFEQLRDAGLQFAGLGIFGAVICFGSMILIRAFFYSKWRNPGYIGLTMSASMFVFGFAVYAIAASLSGRWEPSL